MRKKSSRMLVAASLLVAGLQSLPVWAGYEPILGQISWVPYNFEPRGWAFCNGQILPISTNTALFSLLGTQYGGNGQTTFALPDMRGNLLINAGQGQGLSSYQMGDSGGEERHTLTLSELPAHTHGLMASSATATLTSPEGNVYAQPATGMLYGTNPTVDMAANTLGATGGSGSHNNMMPYTTLHCIIALQGIFPQRP